MSDLVLNTIESRSTGDIWDVSSMGIESGSNENGSWVKFPDGTLIQYGRIPTPVYDPNGYPITLPMAFIDASYSLIAQNGVITTGETYVTSAETINHSVDTFLVKFVANGIGVGGGTYVFNYQAIGRWKAEGTRTDQSKAPAQPEVPVGTVVMYSGLFADIPDNWALCDGNNGTPDLTDSFIMGTTTEADIGTTGGSNDSVVVSHSHTFTGNNLDHYHWSIRETYPEIVYGNLGSTSDGIIYDEPGGYPAIDLRTILTSDPKDGSGNTITLDVTGTISTDGEDDTGKNAPAYVKLAYIMKMS